MGRANEVDGKKTMRPSSKSRLEISHFLRSKNSNIEGLPLKMATDPGSILSTSNLRRARRVR